MQPNYPQQQQYPPQFPQQPGYPQQQGYAPAPAPYAPPQQPGYPPQAYAQPQYTAPQAPPPLPSVGLDEYWEQPSSAGGPSLKFKDAAGTPLIGKSYEGFVARAITNGDIRPQTDKHGQPQYYRDGRPKSVMVVPLILQPSAEFPDGQAGWWVKGQARDDLVRAMAEVGAPTGAPEAAAWVRITLVGVRPIPNMSPAFQYRVEYARPGNPAPAPQPIQAPPAPQQMAAPVVSTAAGQPAVYQQPVPQYAPPVPPAAPQPVPQAAPQPVAQAAPPAAPATGFTAEQQELFARLTGTSAG